MWVNSGAQSKAKRRHFILCELSRLSLELNATHIHIFESVYKHARNIDLLRANIVHIAVLPLHLCGQQKLSPHTAVFRRFTGCMAYIHDQLPFFVTTNHRVHLGEARALGGRP